MTARWRLDRDVDWGSRKVKGARVLMQGTFLNR
jgi:hypothetical protein